VFGILYDEAAADDLRLLRQYDIRRIMNDVDTQLTMDPSVPSRRRKLLKGLLPPWDAVRPVWQLRVGDFRVFYDVDMRRREVTVRAVRRKEGKTTKEIL
jgi:mRNA-degrading endonuclease RelE of RelBE toxin-antitoxin system